MAEYLNSKDFQDHFKMLVKALVLISTKIEDVSVQLKSLEESLAKEKISD